MTGRQKEAGLLPETHTSCPAPAKCWSELPCLPGCWCSRVLVAASEDVLLYIFFLILQKILQGRHIFFRYFSNCSVVAGAAGVHSMRWWPQQLLWAGVAPCIYWGDSALQILHGHTILYWHHCRFQCYLETLFSKSLQLLKQNILTLNMQMVTHRQILNTLLTGKQTPQNERGGGHRFMPKSRFTISFAALCGVCLQ